MVKKNLMYGIFNVENKKIVTLENSVPPKLCYSNENKKN
jgi:hypothetical protein